MKARAQLLELNPNKIFLTIQEISTTTDYELIISSGDQKVILKKPTRGKISPIEKQKLLEMGLSKIARVASRCTQYLSQFNRTFGVQYRENCTNYTLEITDRRQEYILKKYVTP